MRVLSSVLVDATLATMATLKVVISSLLLVLSVVELCEGSHKGDNIGGYETLCVGMGLSGREKDEPPKEGFYSLGMRPYFNYRYYKPFRFLLNADKTGLTGKLIIELSGIKHGTKHDGSLKNWLRVRLVNKNKPTGQFVAFVLFAEDEEGRAVGEFVSRFPCDSTEAAHATKWQIVPCAGTPIDRPLIPGAVVYAANSEKIDRKTDIHFSFEDPKFTDKDFVPRGEFFIYDLYWRFSNFACSNLKTIRFRAHVVLTGALDVGKFQVHSADSPIMTLMPDSFGAPDPIPADPHCEVMNTLTWANFTKTVKLQGSNQHCTVGDFDDPTHTAPSFGGRCSDDFMKPTTDLSMVCRKRPGEDIPLKIDQYLKSFPRCSEACPKTIPKPTTPRPTTPKPTSKPTPKPTSKPVKETKPPTTTTTTTTTTENPPTSTTPKSKPETNKTETVPNPKPNLEATSFYGALSWNAYVIHGSLMSFAIVFVLPVNNFMAHFLKETFLNYRIGYWPPWYFVHIMSIFITFLCGCAGHYALELPLSATGASLNSVAVFHKVVSYFVYQFYVAMAIFGGFRSFNEGVRHACIGLHAIFGWLIYVLGLIAVASSAYIPGSPSGCSDNAQYFQLTILIVLSRLALDIVVFLYLSTYQSKVDKENHITRLQFCCVPIPIVMANETIVDSQGSKMRKYVFALYVAASFIFTCIVIGHLTFADPVGRSFGPSSCTHHRNESVLKRLADFCPSRV